MEPIDIARAAIHRAENLLAYDWVYEEELDEWGRWIDRFWITVSGSRFKIADREDFRVVLDGMADSGMVDDAKSLAAAAAIDLVAAEVVAELEKGEKP